MSSGIVNPQSGIDPYEEVVEPQLMGNPLDPQAAFAAAQQQHGQFGQDAVMPAAQRQTQEDAPAPRSRSEAILKQIQDLQGSRFGVPSMDYTKTQQIHELTALYQHIAQQEEGDLNRSRFDRQYANQAAIQAAHDAERLQAVQGRTGATMYGADQRLAGQRYAADSRFDTNQYTQDNRAQTAADQQETQQQINDDRMQNNLDRTTQQGQNRIQNTGLQNQGRISNTGLKGKLDLIKTGLAAQLKNPDLIPSDEPTTSGPPVAHVSGGAPGPRAAVTPTPDLGPANGKPEGATGTLPDGTKVVVRGGRIVVVG